MVGDQRCDPHPINKSPDDGIALGNETCVCWLEIIEITSGIVFDIAHNKLTAYVFYISNLSAIS